MREFKFFTENKILSPSDVFNIDPMIYQTIIEMCIQGNRYIEECRLNYLRDHPEFNYDDDYSFPIPYNRLEQQFDGLGLLWYGESDYNEQTEIYTHYVFLDHCDEPMVTTYEILEDFNGNFNLTEVYYEPRDY
jgi:hypothetical protein